MISEFEIREFARKNGVPETTVERDYTQNWLLVFLSKLNMALKGGTGIRKIYIENYRFLDDLDFTLLEDVKVSKIKEEINKAVKIAKRITACLIDKTLAPTASAVGVAASFPPMAVAMRNDKRSPIINAISTKLIRVASKASYFCVFNIFRSIIIKELSRQRSEIITYGYNSIIRH